MSAYPWFRFYTEAVHDRKLRRLKPEHRWLFVAMLCAARESRKPGWLMVGDSPMTWDDLVDYASMSLKSIEQGTDLLSDAGLVSYDKETDCWFVTQWDRRQYESDSSKERTRAWRSRKRHGDVTATAGVTPPDTETDTENPQTPLQGAKDCPFCFGTGRVYYAGGGKTGPCHSCAKPTLEVIDGEAG